MLPPPHSRPAWLPLRLLIVSAALAVALLAWQGRPPAEWGRLLTGLLVVSADGNTLATVMGERMGFTFALVEMSMLLAVALAFAVAFVVMRMGCGLPLAAGLLGRFLAALPLSAVAWALVGFTMGKHGWPIESLLPHHPAPGRDTAELALGRTLWSWALPVWILALPLFGELLSETLDRFGVVRHSPLVAGLRARGLKSAVIHYRHVLPQVWPRLIDAIESLGLLALALSVFVEEALGITGWGAFFAVAARAGDVNALAGCIYAAGFIGAVWCLLIDVARRLTIAPEQESIAVALPKRRSRSSVAIAWLSTVIVAAFIASGFGGIDFVAPVVAQARANAPFLVEDLKWVAYASAVAVVLAMLRGVPASVWRLALPVPRLFLLETLCWHPVLIVMLALAAPLAGAPAGWFLLGALLWCGVAVEVRSHGREIYASRMVEASVVAGASRMSAWRAHVLPVLVRVIVSGALRVAATVLVWHVLVESLLRDGSSAPRSLGHAIAAAKDSTLTEQHSLLIPAVITAICALCLRQLSRIIQPAPPHS